MFPKVSSVLVSRLMNIGEQINPFLSLVTLPHPRFLHFETVKNGLYGLTTIQLEKGKHPFKLYSPILLNSSFREIILRRQHKTLFYH